MRDEEFFGLAAREITERQFNEPLMAKAYALALGNPEKTKALYIGMRADQLKHEATIAAANAQAREDERKAAEKAARIEANRQRLAAEKKRKKELQMAQRRREELEAQRVGDAWTYRESVADGFVTSKMEEDFNKAPASNPAIPSPSPPLSPEELDKIIESLKKAQHSKPSLF